MRQGLLFRSEEDLRELSVSAFISSEHSQDLESPPIYSQFPVTRTVVWRAWKTRAKPGAVWKGIPTISPHWFARKAEMLYLLDFCMKISEWGLADAGGICT